MSGDVWIVTDKRTFRKLKLDDPRLDWKWPHSPDGMVRLKAPGKNRWQYVYYGTTVAEAAAAFNRDANEQIAKLEEKIQQLIGGLLKAEP